MASERRVTMAEEESGDDRIVSTLGRLHIKEHTKDSVDPFEKSAGELKKFAGMDSVFKRRVTNELKKANQNYEGSASSKQIEDDYTGYHAFDVVSTPYNLDYLAKLYEISAPHHAAVEAKVANIVGLGYKFVETPKTKRLLEDQAGNEKKLAKTRKALDLHREELTELFESFHEEETFVEILTKVWRDYEVLGNAYIEIARKQDGTIGYVGHIPAQTIRVRTKRDGFVQLSGNKIQFFANFKNPDQDVITYNPVGNDKPNEVIHIKNSSPTNTYYGIPDIMAAQQAIAGNEFASRFNLDYFENKAIPRHLILLKGAKLGSAAENDLLQFFETNLKGQNHRSLFIPLPGDGVGPGGQKVEFKIEPIEAGVQDSSFVNFKKGNDKDIFMVHRVPETKVSVGQGTNLAVARDADKTFKEQVCSPKQRNFEKKIQRILKEFTDAFTFVLNEMTLTDADTQSKIDERNVKAGIWLPNEPRVRDGLPTIPGGEERVDLNAAQKIAQQKAEETTTRARDSARSANSSDSSGEGRGTKGEGRVQA